MLHLPERQQRRVKYTHNISGADRRKAQKQLQRCSGGNYGVS